MPKNKKNLSSRAITPAAKKSIVTLNLNILPERPVMQIRTRFD
jgi:hypothetical protein